MQPIESTFTAKCACLIAYEQTVFIYYGGEEFTQPSRTWSEITARKHALPEHPEPERSISKTTEVWNIHYLS